MSLDIHIGKSKRKHKYYASIKESDFKSMIDELENNSISLNKLNRFKSYYTDITFTNNELLTLKAESDQLLKLNSKHKTLVSSFKHCIEIAIKEEADIFIFAD